MKQILIFLIVLTLQTTQAFAGEACSPEITRTALEKIKILNKQLLAIPLVSTLGEEISLKARLPMGQLNESLHHWMTAELNCSSGKNFDPEKFAAHIQDTIKPIIDDFHHGKDSGLHYGLNWVTLKFDPEQKFLFITTSQGVPCTENVALAGYRIDKDSSEGNWIKILNIATDYSAEDPVSYRFKEPAFIKDPGNGHTNILLTSIPGQCNSMWYGFKFMVIDPAPFENSQQILIISDVYYNGELSDEGGPELKTQGNRFRLSWYSPDFSDHAPGEPVPPETINRTYELKNGIVKSVKTLQNK